MKITIRFDLIDIAENASYREIYRVMSDVVRENWPGMTSVSSEHQRLAQQQVAVSAARHLARTVAARRAR
ncbi:hypothetical protein [Grimontia sp. NTOU-MAR1]|uniref:hypothetical protein n=1 Tax=Grimontia sp. NTOU-MAR1 TaxID=3111011 RepID=UPI002DBFF089|nr:hypothetical protein [Grimontia sp. NTOU-MAR1]WRV99802.1 hypothetical protein VP504_22710 [Grimontia sp. NTOU-MAR1]